MEIQKQSKLTFNGVDVINVQFSTLKPYLKDTSIDIDIQPKVYHPLSNPNHFNLVMEITLHCPSFFKMSVLSIGYFLLETELIEGEKIQFINLNAPAIMFPYMRSFIATFTANLGQSTGLLSIPPHFFKGSVQEISESDFESILFSKSNL